MALGKETQSGLLAVGGQVCLGGRSNAFRDPFHLSQLDGGDNLALAHSDSRSFG
jgi:hypothetical protein